MELQRPRFLFVAALLLVFSAVSQAGDNWVRGELSILADTETLVCINTEERWHDNCEFFYLSFDVEATADVFVALIEDPYKGATYFLEGVHCSKRPPFRIVSPDMVNGSRIAQNVASKKARGRQLSSLAARSRMGPGGFLRRLAAAPWTAAEKGRVICKSDRGCEADRINMQHIRSPHLVITTFEEGANVKFKYRTECFRWDLLHLWPLIVSFIGAVAASVALGFSLFYGHTGWMVARQWPHPHVCCFHRTKQAHDSCGVSIVTSNACLAGIMAVVALVRVVELVRQVNAATVFQTVVFSTAALWNLHVARKLRRAFQQHGQPERIHDELPPQSLPIATVVSPPQSPSPHGLVNGHPFEIADAQLHPQPSSRGFLGREVLPVTSGRASASGIAIGVPADGSLSPSPMGSRNARGHPAPL